MKLAEVVEAKNEALRVRDVAQILGVSVQQIYKMAARGQIPLNIYPKTDTLASESHGLNLSFPVPDLEQKRQRRRTK